eukprot:4407146-Alexandrium_andersonii.AAC.1
MSRIKSVLTPGVASLSHPHMAGLTWGARNPDPSWLVLVARLRRARQVWHWSSEARLLITTVLASHFELEGPGLIREEAQ